MLLVCLRHSLKPSKMEYKRLNTEKISVLGLGTWGMGGKSEKDHSSDHESILAIRQAIRMGITFLDTAEFYANGHTQEIIGEAIEGIDRKNLFISTRISVENLVHSDLIRSTEEILLRLGTQYIDLCSPQKPNPSIPLQDTIKALDGLVSRGLVRHVGVSNFSVEQLKEAQAYSEHGVVANQLEYNLLMRNQSHLCLNVESKVIPHCQENGVVIIAWRPLAQGELAKPGIVVLDDIARRYGKTQAQIALNWLLSKKNVVTIPKASKPAHIKENLGALGWKLTQEDMRKLDKLEDIVD